jgi:hypothetical protein
MPSVAAARIVAASLRVPTGDGLAAPDVADLIDGLTDALETAYACMIVQRSVRLLVDKTVHTPARIRAYLLASGWVCERQRERSSDWRHEAKGLIGHLLDDDSYSDYEKVTALLVTEAAITAGVGELQVLADIAEAGDA